MYRPQPPVEHGDEALHGGAGDAEVVLEPEEVGAEGEVGEQGDEEGEGGEGEADDGEVLQVPAVGGIAGGRWSAVGGGRGMGEEGWRTWGWG